MGEGVDPTQMCQSLVNKVAQSEQLSAITDPDLLALFEDWLEELENEVQMIYKSGGAMNEDTVAGKLGLSRRGTKFLLSKMFREGKINAAGES